MAALAVGTVVVAVAAPSGAGATGPVVLAGVEAGAGARFGAGTGVRAGGVRAGGTSLGFIYTFFIDPIRGP